MGKEGKIGVLSVLIASIVILIFYSVFVVGIVPIEFPVNGTNASLTAGYADPGINLTLFNGTNAQFRVNVSSQNATTLNVTRVVLFLNKSGVPSDNNSAGLNQTLWLNHSTAENTPEVMIFNLSSTLDEGVYFWFVQMEDNGSPDKAINQSENFTFTIDRTPPGFSNFTNSSINSTKVSTGDVVYILANFSDQLTSLHTIRLFVNTTGTANNEVNSTGVVANGVNTNNNSLMNLSFAIPPSAVGDILNFTLQVNDSVNNVNITSAIIVTVEGDGTPPGPINLSGPIDLFNTTSNTDNILFNFSVIDNNDTNFQCDLNISLQGTSVESISEIDVVNGTKQSNASSVVFTNGAYAWSVNCTDGAGNFNTSVARTFTVDQIPPVVVYYNFTNQTNFNTSTDGNSFELNTNATGSRAQGDAETGVIYGFANWTDNLTQPFQAALQFYNRSSESWQSLNTSPGGYRSIYNSTWTNFSYPIQKGPGEFEGRNVSFRIIGNDTVGNVNTSTVKNFTIQVNDTTGSRIVINGTIAINGTNISNTRPIISWVVNEGSGLASINISVDGTRRTGTGIDGCKKSAFYDTSVGDENVELFRNGSFQVSAVVNCPLANGTHNINVTAIDAWNNKIIVTHNFNIESGVNPNITLQNLGNGLTAINNSNVTSFTGINFTAVDGGASKMRIFSWSSSCNAVTQTLSSGSADFPAANVSYIHPFNYTSCNTASENRTVTITVEDDAGNSQTKVYQFLVDNVGPAMTVISPTDGQTFPVGSLVSLNFSAIDDDQSISTFGYYLDDNVTLNIINRTNGIWSPGVTITNGTWINHTGTHTVKFTVNDTLGNVVNSSEITFTQIGTADAMATNTTVRANNANLSNVSFFRVNGTPIKAGFEVNQTLELFLGTNISAFVGSSTASANTTINFNGTAANWDSVKDIYVNLNDSTQIGFIQSNMTAKVNLSITFNRSFVKFLPDNNSYFGSVRVPMNASNLSRAGILGGDLEFWYFSDEDDYSLKTNITQCAVGYSPAHSTALSAGSFPCWNNTNNQSVDVYVPHFSTIVLAENDGAPTINVTTPVSANQSIGSFVPNITVSSDAVGCTYSVNSSVANASMTLSENVCIGVSTDFANYQTNKAGYNITFTVNDSSGNVNTYFWAFNVTDKTKPTNPNSSTVSTSVTSTTGVITVSDINETVKVNISYGTTIGALTSTVQETDFTKTQAVTISSLTASKLYHFNVTVCDYNNNCAKNGTFNFTTGSADAAAAAAASSSSSSSGGGSTTTSTVSDSKAQVWSSVPSGSSFSLDVDKTGIGITSVQVEGVKLELSNVELSVASLSENPVADEPAAKVFQYLRITKKNLKNSDADSFKVGFRVTKAWLDENGLASGDVALYRFADSAWNELVTSVAGTDSIYVNYEADTPGFSSFAIAASSTVAGVEEAPEDVEEAPEGTEEAPEEVEKPVPVQAPGKSPVAWVIAAIVVILGIILIVAYQKKKK